VSAEAFACPECGETTEEDEVLLSLWEAERLVLIENVPVRICPQCHEQYYGQETRLEIEKLRSRGFPQEEATRVVETPVFSLSTDVSPDGKD
jgi:YgiT-type zinc finger domain-containing protein